MWRVLKFHQVLRFRSMCHKTLCFVMMKHLLVITIVACSLPIMFLGLVLGLQTLMLFCPADNYWTCSTCKLLVVSSCKRGKEKGWLHTPKKPVILRRHFYAYFSPFSTGCRKKFTTSHVGLSKKKNKCGKCRLKILLRNGKTRAINTIWRASTLQSTCKHFIMIDFKISLLCFNSKRLQLSDGFYRTVIPCLRKFEASHQLVLVTKWFRNQIHKKYIEISSYGAEI